MQTVSVTEEVDAPKAEVWAVLDEFDNLEEYSPRNRSCELIDGSDTGVGSRRETTLTDASRVVHEIVEYEPRERYTFEYNDPSDQMVAAFQIEFDVAASGDGTTVTATARYEPKLGPVGWVLGKTTLADTFRERLEETLDGLDAHVRTGEPVGTEATA
ncbi:MAG: SRPBCC family protein [Halobacteriaceae archaeon]